MAEVHIIGQISGAVDFDDRSLFVKYTISSGSCWKTLEGFTEGQTHLSRAIQEDTPDKGSVNTYSWSHPIDVHYVTKGMSGWPKFELQAWGVDWLGKCNISAYGFINIPSRAGSHELTCSTWRPVGDFRRRLLDSITGYRMHIMEPSEMVAEGLSRNYIQSVSMGVINLNLQVILKGFDRYGIDL